MKKRVVIAGFGDTGLLVAINLPKTYEVIGISTKPCHLSGQELGTRLTQPEIWKQNYCVSFERYNALKGIDLRQGRVVEVDTDGKRVCVHPIEGGKYWLDYDVLVIASGVANGFWRTPKVETPEQIHRQLKSHQERLTSAKQVAIIGGGPTAVSTASNLKEQYPHIDVNLFYSQAELLMGYHIKTQNSVTQQLKQQGVNLNPNHRAVVPSDFDFTDFTHSAIHWQTGQEAFKPDLTLWCIGNLKPNNQFIPSSMLNDQGFVKVDSYLRVKGYDGVFAIGDIAASDPLRSSARNAGFLTAAHNINQCLQKKPHKMKVFKAPKHRWGSVLGVQKNGMRIFTPQGVGVLVSPWWVKKLLFPFFVRKMIYKGINNSSISK